MLKSMQQRKAQRRGILENTLGIESKKQEEGNTQVVVEINGRTRN